MYVLYIYMHYIIYTIYTYINETYYSAMWNPSSKLQLSPPAPGADLHRRAVERELCQGPGDVRQQLACHRVDSSPLFSIEYHSIVYDNMILPHIRS